MDELEWTELSDQFGLTNPSLFYTGLTVNTIDGVTYVAATQPNGNTDLWTYDSASSSLTLVGHRQGIDQNSDDLVEPQIMSIDGKVVIVGGTQSSALRAYSYDPANPPTITSQTANTLTAHPEFSQTLYGNTESKSFHFTASNGKQYFLNQNSFGSYDGGTVSFDANGDLVFDHMVVSSRGFRSSATGADESHVIVNEERTTTHPEAYNVRDPLYTVSFQQVGDVVLEFVGSGTNHGSFRVVKWEVDSAGELSGSQVIYTDGTTLKDLADNGYDTQPYPEVSPFDSSGVPLNSADFPQGSYLNKLAVDAGLSQIDHPDGSVDAIDFRNVRAIETFEHDGKIYMFAGSTASGHDGAGIFEVDPNTGMPFKLVDFVEGDIRGQLDADDAHFSFTASFVDIQTQTVNATGEIVISAVSNSAVLYFKFDPAGGLGTGDTSVNGALTFIGTEGHDTVQAYNFDTFGTNYLGRENVDGYEILPDGNVIVANGNSLWLAKPGVQDINTATVVCFVAGTRIATEEGSIAVEDLRPGIVVLTVDSGPVPVRWVGSRTVTAAELDASEKLFPIRIRKGALGDNCPASDLFVSRQHRILVKSKIAQRMFGVDEILVPAIKLTGIDGIEIIKDVDEVTYVHFLFDRHELVFANEAAAESFYAGPGALSTVSTRSRKEIYRMFPSMYRKDYKPHAARLFADGKEAHMLVARHVKNQKPLYVHS